MRINNKIANNKTVIQYKRGIMKMKVLVTLPNGHTTYCVECYPKAIGRDCLEKVHILI